LAAAPGIAAAGTPWATEGHAGARAGAGARALGPADRLLDVERRLDGGRTVGEDRHVAVAEAFDDPAAVVTDGRLDDLLDGAEELERGLVADFEHPVREPDEVREQKRRALGARAAAGLLRPRLPPPQRRHPGPPPT